jgi:hypothetical protein
MTIIYWILFYVLPVVIVCGLGMRLKSFKAGVVIHIGLIVSILLFLLAGTRLNIPIEIFSLVCFLVSASFSIYLLGKISFLYIISSILQELCLLLAFVFLMQGTTLIVAMLCTTIVYALSHLINRCHWQLKMFITCIWGICSILLYFYFKQPLFNIAIHIIGGAILIRQGVLYTKIQEKEVFLS